MPKRSIHPNASVIRSQSVWVRRIARTMIAIAVLVMLVARVMPDEMWMKRTSDGVSMLPLFAAAIGCSLLFLLYYHVGGSTGLTVFWRMLTGQGRRSMGIWARSRGWRPSHRRSFHFPFPEMRETQFIYECVVFPHERTNREWVVFDAKCRDKDPLTGTILHMTGIAFTVDPSWTVDLPLVTVSPGSQAYVGGGHNLRDRRWERHDLDTRFQIDARVTGPESELKFVQLFSPDVQMALGDSFCAYWQQTNSWILVWIPMRFVSPQQIEALYQDALWLHDRYAQFARAGAGARPAAAAWSEAPLPTAVGDAPQQGTPVAPPVPVPVPLPVPLDVQPPPVPGRRVA